MSPISMEHLLALTVFVASVAISPGSALFGLQGWPDNLAFRPLPDKSDWTPEKLMEDLSEGYQPKGSSYYRKEYGLAQEIPGTVYSWLSRTSDKNRPVAILGKYSVQELLDLNLVYDKKATLQEYDRRKQICEDISPGEFNEKRWRSSSRFPQSGEEKLLNQKFFLSQYCRETFRVFRYSFMDYIDKQVKRKLSKKDMRNFDNFHISLMDKLQEARNKGLTRDEITEEHIKSYDEKELAKLRASCLKLDQFAEILNLVGFDQTKSGKNYNYCKKIEICLNE